MRISDPFDILGRPRFLPNEGEILEGYPPLRESLSNRVVRQTKEANLPSSAWIAAAVLAVAIATNGINSGEGEVTVTHVPAAPPSLPSSTFRIEHSLIPQNP